LGKDQRWETSLPFPTRDALKTPWNSFRFKRASCRGVGVYWKRNNNKNRIKEMSINLLKQSPMCRFSVTLYIFSPFFSLAPI
jgi:hypothetical protein